MLVTDSAVVVLRNFCINYNLLMRFFLHEQLIVGNLMKLPVQTVVVKYVYDDSLVVSFLETDVS